MGLLYTVRSTYFVIGSVSKTHLYSLDLAKTARGREGHPRARPREPVGRPSPAHFCITFPNRMHDLMIHWLEYLSFIPVTVITVFDGNL